MHFCHQTQCISTQILQSHSKQWCLETPLALAAKEQANGCNVISSQVALAVRSSATNQTTGLSDGRDVKCIFLRPYCIPQQLPVSRSCCSGCAAPCPITPQPYKCTFPLQGNTAITLSSLISNPSQHSSLAHGQLCSS